jgi:hypothetical protein
MTDRCPSSKQVQPGFRPGTGKIEPVNGFLPSRFFTIAACSARFERVEQTTEPEAPAA